MQDVAAKVDDSDTIIADSVKLKATDEDVISGEEIATELPKDDPAEHYKKDLHSAKERVRKLEQELKDEKIKKLKENENWQEVARIKTEEADTANEERDSLRNGIVFDKKYQAVRESAIRAGIRNEALADLELLDLSAVDIETTSLGNINVLGADKFVANLKTLKPHWFGGKGSRVNPGNPEVIASAGATYEDVEKAQKKAQETGNYGPYEKVLVQFKQKLANTR